ncbi:BIG1-domain-containing protein [Patellaria atrata CBS 101060]|uniref:Protein BIG1 n=1 Tax=Patellaria atrata CBS 101060 TaxID=1346257 RepID=A0A9P4SHU6_9PEZI|nr:BIG1-domain-containing protein [Patellaria atrata CBS 101060]
MNMQRFWIAALALPSVLAFQDTSPFFLFSTSQSGDTFQNIPQISTFDNINLRLLSFFSSCPSENYIVVNQPGVSYLDYSSRNSAPYLERWLKGENKIIETAALLPEVVKSNSGIDRVKSHLRLDCGVKLQRIDGTTGELSFISHTPRMIEIDFPVPPSEAAERAKLLISRDAFVNAVVNDLKSNKFTVIYTTTPPSEEQFVPPSIQYEMDDPYPSAPHMELKRAYSTYNNQTSSNLPLFEKYQFLSPGIFMTGTVSLALLMILYVGISAISSLEVSYFAFSKEMGPAAQRKQQ